MITHKKFLSVIPSQIYTIEVPNVLVAISYITSLFYPNSIDDVPDFEVSCINKNDFKKLMISNIGGYSIFLPKYATIKNTMSEIKAKTTIFFWKRYQMGQ